MQNNQINQQSYVLNKMSNTQKRQNKICKQVLYYMVGHILPHLITPTQVWSVYIQHLARYKDISIQPPTSYIYLHTSPNIYLGPQPLYIYIILTLVKQNQTLWSLTVTLH